MFNRKLRKPIVCIILVLILGTLSLSPAFADQEYYQGHFYNHGSFSFTDYTLSSMKHMMGRYILFRVDFHKPDWDSGWGDINLTFEIRDADSGQCIAGPYVMGPAGSTSVSNTYYWVDLGYTGRYVRFWFDASSAGQSNGNYRSATVDVFKVYVYEE